MAIALSGKGRVSEGMRLKIRATAQELGYDGDTNRDARAMAAKRYGTHLETRTLGIVYDRTYIDNYYATTIYRGMQLAAEQHDYDLLNLIRVRPNWSPEHEGLQYLDRRTDGLIFFTPFQRDELLQTLVRHKIPVVAISMQVPAGVAHIKLDNRRMAKLAVDHLVQHGHRRIALLGGENHSDYDERREGFVAAMNSAGVSVETVATSQYYDERGWQFDTEAMASLLDAKPTAVVCVNDHLAISLWRIAEARGLSVPGDLSIVGMDDLSFAAEKGLTTIRFSCEEMGRAAVESVLNAIHEVAGRAQVTTIPTDLVERASVAAPRPHQTALFSGAVR